MCVVCQRVLGEWPRIPGADDEELRDVPAVPDGEAAGQPVRQQFLLYLSWLALPEGPPIMDEAMVVDVDAAGRLVGFVAFVVCL